MLGRSGFDNSFNSVEDAASYNIQGVIFLGNSLMWNDTAVCSGIMELIFCERLLWYVELTWEWVRYDFLGSPNVLGV